uniref:Uncharacterized protein n=1 Tax=Picea glauca TaxID=3330 RepID=A0A101LYR7_PICGL|nr:hypothetical protein ABT39_MTgene4833 [Picea glauca]
MLVELKGLYNSYNQGTHFICGIFASSISTSSISTSNICHVILLAGMP